MVNCYLTGECQQDSFYKFPSLLVVKPRNREELDVGQCGWLSANVFVKTLAELMICLAYFLKHFNYF